MNTTGRFIFKSATYRDGGEFTNDDNRVVKYNGYYLLKVDEINEKNEINERRFKLSLDNKNLVEKVRNIRPYEPISMTFDVLLYQNSVKLNLKDVEIVKEAE